MKNEINSGSFSGFFSMVKSFLNPKKLAVVVACALSVSTLAVDAEAGVLDTIRDIAADRKIKKAEQEVEESFYLFIRSSCRDVIDDRMKPLDAPYEVNNFTLLKKTRIKKGNLTLYYHVYKASIESENNYDIAIRMVLVLKGKTLYNHVHTTVVTREDKAGLEAAIEEYKKQAEEGIIPESIMIF